MNPCRGTYVMRDGKLVKVEYVQPRVTDPYASGLVSEAASVHPAQIKEARALLARHGVQTDFDQKGRPTFRSRSHRKAHCEALGFIDKSGGYGDATMIRERQEKL